MKIQAIPAKKIIAGISFGALASLPSVLAHCPLCTMGAAAAAGGAAYLGVNKAIIGLFVGAFAASTGFWMNRWIKKEYIPHQKVLIVTAAFLLTVIPLFPIIRAYYPLYIPWAGEYGITYALNISVVASVAGGLLVALAPSLSKTVSSLRNGKTLPFQGVTLTFLLLAIAGLLIQVVL